MRYAHKNKIEWIWHRMQLKNAIRAYCKSQAGEQKQRILSLLEKSLLFIPVKEVPHFNTNKHGQIQGNIPIKFLSGSGPEGGKSMLCFTDKRELRSYHKQAGAIVFNIRDTLRTLPRDHVGITINPAKHSIFISRAELARYTHDPQENAP